MSTATLTGPMRFDQCPMCGGYMEYVGVTTSGRTIVDQYVCTRCPYTTEIER